MRRGTTPKITITTEFDWTAYAVQVTMKENDVELVVEEERITKSEDGTILEFNLTQEETLMFTKKAQVQIKAKLGSSVIATDISSLSVLPILNEEVM